MLRWYLAASELTAFNQFLAHQDLTGPLLKLSARYRVNFNNINSLHTSCFSIICFDIYSLWFFTGIDGSDFLSSQLLASLEQISFSLVFFWMRVSGFCHTYIFLSIESVITLLILNWKNVVLTTLWLLKRDLFKTCYIKSERKNLWSWFNLFFLLRYCLNNFMFYNGWKSFTNYGRIHDIFFVINWSWRAWEALYRLDRKLGGLPSSVVGARPLHSCYF